MSKPSVGIFGLTGCAGDQLVVLNCEDQLLELVSLLDVRDFLMADSAGDTECDLDIALVEGAVMSTRDEATLLRIRQRSRVLIAIGTCAVWGGVAATDRNGNLPGLVQDIYGVQVRNLDVTKARALHEVVAVDLKITGCPIEKTQFLSAIASVLNGDPPVFPLYSVCSECRTRESNCVLVESGVVCCGPLTVAGCDARCPALRIPCIGCRGLVDDANLASAWAMFGKKGVNREDIEKKLQAFAPVGTQS